MFITEGEGMRRTTGLSKEEVQNRIDKIHDNTILMTNYTKASAKADFECLICCYTWSTQPRSLYTLKTGCPDCAGNAPITTDDLKERIYKLVGNEYSLLTKCNGRHSKVTLLHDKCGQPYEVEVGSFLCGKRHTCDLSERISEALSYTLDDMLSLLSKAWGDEIVYEKGFSSVSEYAWFFHTKCGYSFRALPRQLYSRYRGCSHCSTSKGELTIEDYLKKNNISFESQFKIEECRDKRCLPFDFAVFNDKELTCLIEFQGQQHYDIVEVFGKESCLSTMYHDKIKKQYCINNSISLLYIPTPSKNQVSYDKMKRYVSDYLNKHMPRPSQALLEI